MAKRPNYIINREYDVDASNIVKAILALPLADRIALHDYTNLRIYYFDGTLYKLYGYWR